MEFRYGFETLPVQIIIGVFLEVQVEIEQIPCEGALKCLGQTTIQFPIHGATSTP